MTLRLAAVGALLLAAAVGLLTLAIVCLGAIANHAARMAAAS
jgi:hypothetical protein